MRRPGSSRHWCSSTRRSPSCTSPSARRRPRPDTWTRHWRLSSTASNSFPATCPSRCATRRHSWPRPGPPTRTTRSEEHTSELQSQSNLVCRLLLEKKKIHLVIQVARFSNTLFCIPAGDTRLIHSASSFEHAYIVDFHSPSLDQHSTQLTFMYLITV